MFGFFLITIFFSITTLRQSEAVFLNPIKTMERLKEEKFQELCKFVCEISRLYRIFLDADRQFFCNVCNSHFSTTPASSPTTETSKEPSTTRKSTTKGQETETQESASESRETTTMATPVTTKGEGEGGGSSAMMTTPSTTSTVEEITMQDSTMAQ